MREDEEGKAIKLRLRLGPSPGTVFQTCTANSLGERIKGAFEVLRDGVVFARFCSKSGSLCGTRHVRYQLRTNLESVCEVI